MKAFEAKYPGVKAEVYRSQSSDLGKRIMTENKAKPFIWMRSKPRCRFRSFCMKTR